jgi:hypothetical protein
LSKSAAIFIYCNGKAWRDTVVAFVLRPKQRLCDWATIETSRLLQPVQQQIITLHWAQMAKTSYTQQRKWEMGCWWGHGGTPKTRKIEFSHLIHTNSIPPVYGRLKTIVLFQCCGSINVEGHEVNEFIEASNGWSLCSLLIFVLRIWVFSKKKMKKLATVLSSRT